MSRKEEGKISQQSRPKQEKNLDDDDDLERLAVEALLEDTRRRKLTVDRVGTMGWVKQRQVNKRFLNSVVLQTVSRHATKKVRVHGGLRSRSDRETTSEGRQSDFRTSRDQSSRSSEGERHFQRRARERDSSCNRETKKQRLTEERRRNESGRDRRASPQGSVYRERRVSSHSGKSPRDYGGVRHSRQPRTTQK